MAFNVKKTFADTLLDLCKTKPLKSVSIADLLEQTGISRQTFYNYFRDKDDLIQWVYQDRIAIVWERAGPNVDYYPCCVDFFTQMKAHKSFLVQACKMTGQNCLRDFSVQYAKEWNIKWFQTHYGSQPIPPECRFILEYHTVGLMEMSIAWILAGMPTTAEEMADLANRVRCVSLGNLLSRTQDG